MFTVRIRKLYLTKFAAEKLFKNGITVDLQKFGSWIIPTFRYLLGTG